MWCCASYIQINTHREWASGTTIGCHVFSIHGINNAFIYKNICFSQPFVFACHWNSNLVHDNDSTSHSSINNTEFPRTSKFFQKIGDACFGPCNKREARENVDDCDGDCWKQRNESDTPHNFFAPRHHQKPPLHKYRPGLPLTTNALAVFLLLGWHSFYCHCSNRSCNS